MKPQRPETHRCKCVLVHIPYPPQDLGQMIALDLLLRYENDLLMMAIAARLTDGCLLPAHMAGAFTLN